MADHKPPDWLDRRTAEWCADLCSAVAARVLRYRTPEIGMRQGAEICSITIRSMVLGHQAPRPDLLRASDGSPVREGTPEEDLAIIVGAAGQGRN